MELTLNTDYYYYHYMYYYYSVEKKCNNFGPELQSELSRSIVGLTHDDEWSVRHTSSENYPKSFEIARQLIARHACIIT